ncbi:hypothetical protein [Pseudomonas sp. FME51]|uniref:hypothetical protein n=1 Tax=Pseudomonas sp. FME51 TaxID=2742609 RepID=UPI0018677656|nr:hypothetical protein [Pseudomonas sp. FME51]
MRKLTAMNTLIMGFTLLGAVLSSAVAWAHVPVSRCSVQADNWVECQTRYDDDSLAADILMGLYSYDNSLLSSGRSDVKGVFRFALPAQPFYLLMDAGPGHVFEVDWKDIDGIDGQLFAAASTQ